MNEILAAVSANRLKEDVHVFEINGTFIILDINSASIHIADEQTACYIQALQQSNGDIEEFLKQTAQLTPQERDEIEGDLCELIAQGTLFSQSDNTAGKQIASQIKSLCLHISHDCNLRCQYCFAGTGHFGGERMHMPLETGKQAIDFLLKNSGNRKALEIDFFGGEPLLNFHVVKMLVEYGEIEAPKFGKKITFTLTTNGVALSDEVIDWLNHKEIAVVLSLDGRKSVNDCKRPFPGGQGSYDIIVPRFKKLVEGRRDTNYYIRGTFTKDNLDFTEDIKAMLEEGFTRLSLEPVVAESDAAYAFAEEDVEILKKEYEKLALFFEQQREKQDITFFHYNIEIYKGPCLPKRLSGCGAGFEYFAVTPEGKLYPCHQFVGKDEYLMGTLEEGISNNSAVKKFQEANVYAKAECRACWARFYCSGGCHANAYNQNGDILKPYAIGCELQRKRIECAIYLEVKKLLSLNK